MPFVTLNEGGWDHHTALFDGFDKRLPAFESSIAALIEDLDQRGLLDTTLVVALGEFGRTPKINKDGGRDHWSNAMSVLFAGCGTPGGQVVGATDARGYAAMRARPLPRELRRHGLHEARHRPRQDPLHPQRPARLPGERPDPDPGIDGMSQRSRTFALLFSRGVGRGHHIAVAKPPTLTGICSGRGRLGARA